MRAPQLDSLEGPVIDRCQQPDPMRPSGAVRELPIQICLHSLTAKTSGQKQSVVGEDHKGRSRKTYRDGRNEASVDRREGLAGVEGGT